MELIYDAIFGLSYNNIGSFYSIDLCKIPENINVEDFLIKWKEASQLGICLSDAVEEFSLPIYSNY